MLDKIIFYSIKNKLIIAILSFALLVIGVWSLTKLPIDAVPDITNNQVQIITSSPSLAAQEVERLITYPVEVGMSNIPGVEEVRSISRFGLSVVTVVFKDEIDIYWARQQVNDRLLSIGDQVPAKIGVPKLAPVTSGLGEIYQYTIHPKSGYEKKYSALELRSIQDWIVRRQLLGTEGVADISSFGGFLKQYEISIDPDKLKSQNVTITEIFNAIEKNNENTGGAYIDKNPNAWFIRTEGLVQSIADIEAIVIKRTSNGIPVLVKNVASVTIGHANRFGAMTYNTDGEVVGAVVMMLKGENSNKVIRNVKEKMQQIQKSLPEGVVIEAFLDRTSLVDRAIHTVSKNLIEGAIIVIFVLVLFLGNLRAGLVVASVIPLAMLFAVTMMNIFGVSGNLMSLGAIDFGLIVDGAVIIVEATLHHLHITHKISQKNILSQHEMDEEVYQSAVKIRSSAAFGEIIILIVYLPILSLVGIEGKMFKPMAQTVGFAILGAFILSITYVPMVSAMFLSKNISFKTTFSDRMMLFLQRKYEPVLLKVLKFRKWVIVTSLLFLVLSIFTLFQMGGEFIPTLDEGDFAVETRVLTGSSMQQTIDAALKASEILKKEFPDEVKEVIGKVGTSEIPTDPMPLEACDLMVILNDKSVWTKADTRDDLANLMQSMLENIPGVTFSFQQPIQMRFNELMTGAKQDVAMKIYGDNLDTLSRAANDLGVLINAIDGLKDLYIEEVTGLPQIVINYKRDKIALFGLDIETVNKVVRTAFAGEKAGVVYEDEKQYELVVRLAKEKRQSISDVQQLFVPLPNGAQIPLNQVADVAFRDGPTQIQRDDTKRRITVAFNVRGRDVESIVAEIQNKVNEKLHLPPGYFITYGGQFKNLQQAKQRLGVAVPVALMLIFVLLYFTFHSIKQSVLIFTAIPLSAIGGIWALWLRGMPFSISAGVGFIALFGVAVLNGIVLIAEFNYLKNKGLTSLKQIVLEGTSNRLRPVLMTATVASLGFLPMALSNGSGAEVQKPLATVVIGGLLSATILTLLVLPVLYTYFESKQKIKVTINTSLLVFLVTIFGFSLHETKAQELSLSQVLEQAKAKNYSLKAADNEYESLKYLKKSYINIPSTTIGVMYGQYNSYYNDNGLTISQNIPLPSTWIRQKDVYSQLQKFSEIEKKLVDKELKFQVKKLYAEISFQLALQYLVKQQDSIWNYIYQSIQKRQALGDGNALEVAVAQSQYLDFKRMGNQVEIQIEQLYKELNVLILSESNFKIGFDFKTYTSYTDSIVPNNMSQIQHPQLMLFNQKVNIATSQYKYLKSSFLPSINLGYFNQTMYGTVDYRNSSRVASGVDRFQGVNVGINAPLWFKSNWAQNKASKLQIEKAENLALAHKNSLQLDYEKALSAYQMSKVELENMRNQQLPLVDKIIQNADKSFKSGAISYLEYNFAWNKAHEIKLNYVQLIQKHQLNVLKLEYYNEN